MATETKLNHDGSVYDEEKSKNRKRDEPCSQCFLTTACDCGSY